MTNGIDAEGVPLPPESWVYSARLLGAMVVAGQVHAGQFRKHTKIPYLSHVLGACSIAWEYGATEDEAIAALLHDVLEDGKPVEAARAAVESFGPEVAQIVEGCTHVDAGRTPTWRDRREAYVARVATSDHSVLLVSASDKLHNARSIVRDLHGVGAEVWSRFNAPKADTLWYYRTLVTAYRANPEHNVALVDELDRTVSEMERLAEVVTPAR